MSELRADRLFKKQFSPFKQFACKNCNQIGKMLYNSSNAISDLLKLAEGKKGKNEINVTNWESSRKKRKNKVLKTRKNIMKKVAQNSKKNIPVFK